MEIVPVPQWADNYAYLLIDPASGAAAVVDCADATPVLEAAAHRNVKLTAVLATHHHLDHVAGNKALVGALPGVTIYGAAEEANRIPGLTDPLADGAEVCIGTLRGRAILVPAHTRGHLAYHFPAQRALFTGDTLFIGGCGRLFEGDAAEMMRSLAKLTALPDDTRVYCGHEYTERNLQFALTLEPTNEALRRKLASAEAARRRGEPTVPSTIAEEKATNPFLRIDSQELADSIRQRVPGLHPGDTIGLFAALRGLKDRF